MAANRKRGDERDAWALVETGAELAGSLGGVALGLVGGAGAELGGAALSVAITRAVKAVGGRLWARERERAGAAILLIAEDAESRRERGERPRDDGFFDERGGLRSDAVELLEGVLRQAAAAHEERKLPLFARLYSAVAHDASVPPGDAQYLVRVASELTYRQFVALATIPDQNSPGLASLAEMTAIHPGMRDPAMMLEIDDLGDRRLLGVQVSSGGGVAAVGETYGSAAPITSHGLFGLRRTAAGALLVRLTSADMVIPAEDRDAWLRSLLRPEARGERNVHLAAGASRRARRAQGPYGRRPP